MSRLVLGIVGLGPASEPHAKGLHDLSERIEVRLAASRGADKAQVAFMVRALLGLTETPPPDAADALAIGLTHLRAQSSPLLKIQALARI